MPCNTKEIVVEPCGFVLCEPVPLSAGRTGRARRRAVWQYNHRDYGWEMLRLFVLRAARV
jgi:hypothetical protein